MARQKSFKQKVAFSLFAPDAQEVILVGSFNGWGQAPVPLKKSKNGSWTATVPLEPGTHEYRYLVDGEWRDDPDCPMRVANPFGAENCVRVVEVSPPGPLS